MSMPIVAQLRICSEDAKEVKNWANLFLLKDGSTYLVSTEGEVKPIDRSYAGQMIKVIMKHRLTQYHTTMRYRADFKHKSVYDFECMDAMAREYDTRCADAKFVWNKFKTTRYVKSPKANTNTPITKDMFPQFRIVPTFHTKSTNMPTKTGPVNTQSIKPQKLVQTDAKGNTLSEVTFYFVTPANAW